MQNLIQHFPLVLNQHYHFPIDQGLQKPTLDHGLNFIRPENKNSLNSTSGKLKICHRSLLLKRQGEKERKKEKKFFSARAVAKYIFAILNWVRKISLKPDLTKSLREKHNTFLFLLCIIITIYFFHFISFPVLYSEAFFSFHSRAIYLNWVEYTACVLFKNRRLSLSKRLTMTSYDRRYTFQSIFNPRKVDFSLPPF